MSLRKYAVALVVLLIPMLSAAQRHGNKGDIYFGYSRVGANLYAANTPAMNGWQFAAHFKPTHYFGVEGDISHYTQSVNGYSQQVTLVMFGPRVTLHTKNVSVFAHGLAGIAHESATLTTYPGVSYDATSYALGGGADIPLRLAGLNLRATGDYLGNSSAPSSGSQSPEHYRLGVGLAWHF